VQNHLPRPDRERISALTALILLTYGLIRTIALPTINTDIAALGLVFEFEFNALTVMLSLAAILAASGADWLIRGHPLAKHQPPAPDHWILPGLAAVAIGEILVRINEGIGLWVGILFGALFLVAVLAAEFIVYDPDDPRTPTVEIGLRGLAFLLIAGTLFTVGALGSRALLALPIVFFVSSAICWRLLRLTFQKVSLGWPILIGIFSAQTAGALHYWPILPASWGLLLTICVYVCYQLVSSHLEGQLSRRTWIELGLVSSLSVLMIGILV
jgi:hypothetical protein